MTDVPVPGEDLIFTSPPWSSTKERTRARPRPAPRVSPEVNESNTHDWRSGAMPLPLSETARRMMFSLGTGLDASILMWPPAPVKRRALVSRLNSTCLMRRSSAWMLPMRSSQRISTRTLVFSAVVTTRSTASSIAPSQGELRQLQLHASGFDHGEIQDVADDFGEVVGGGQDRDDLLALLVGEGARALALEQFGIAEDGREGRAQLVGDVLHELVLRACRRPAAPRSCPSAPFPPCGRRSRP